MSLQRPLLGHDLKYRLSGQPRTGDRPFAELVERVIGAGNIYRCKSYIQISPFVTMTKMDRCALGR